MLLEKINDLLAFGIAVKFSREINQFRVELSNEKGEKKHVVLPYSHLDEERICEYIDLMKKEFKTK